MKKATTLVCAFVILRLATPVFAQTVSFQLDSMVAPIALYPDPLLSQVLVASTYPQDVVDAAEWLRQNRGLSGSALQQAAKAYDWDPSIQALLAFPDVLDRLSENIQWTTNLGNAFLTQEADVMDAVQRMRNQAMTSGTLATNGQAVVTREYQGPATVVAIQPASPEIIYVPVYDPFTVWGSSAYPYPILRYNYAPAFIHYSRMAFLPGIRVSSYYSGWSGWSSWGWQPNWNRRTVVINNNFYDRYGYRYREHVRYPSRVVVNRTPVVRQPVVRPPVSRPTQVDRTPNVSPLPSNDNRQGPTVDNRPNRPAPSTPVVRRPSNSQPAPRTSEQKSGGGGRREPQGRGNSSENRPSGNRSSGNRPDGKTPGQ